MRIAMTLPELREMGTQTQEPWTPILYDTEGPEREGDFQGR